MLLNLGLVFSYVMSHFRVRLSDYRFVSVLRKVWSFSFFIYFSLFLFCPLFFLFIFHFFACFPFPLSFCCSFNFFCFLKKINKAVWTGATQSQYHSGSKNKNNKQANNFLEAHITIDSQSKKQLFIVCYGWNMFLSITLAVFPHLFPIHDSNFLYNKIF